MKHMGCHRSLQGYERPIKRQREFNQIYSLPKRQYLKMLEECDHILLNEVAQKYDVSLSALYIIYREHKKELENREKNSTGYIRKDYLKNLITSVKAEKNENKEECIIAYNHNSEIVFMGEYTNEILKQIKVMIYTTARQIIDTPTQSSPLNKIKKNWQTYFALEDRFCQAKVEQLKKATTEMEKKEIRSLDIKCWELNRITMTPEKINHRLEKLEKMGKTTEQENENQSKVSFETITYIDSKTKESKTISENMLFPWNAYTITSLQAIDTENVYMINMIGKKQIKTWLQAFACIQREFAKLKDNMKKQNIGLEQLSPRLYEYYQTCQNLSANKHLISALVKFNIQKYNPHVFQNICGEITEIHTARGTLSREEFELFIEIFTSDYKLKYTIIGDDVLCQELFMAGKQYKKFNHQYFGGSTTRDKYLQFLEIVSKSDVSGATPLFKDLINHAQWIVTQEKLIEAYLSEDVPEVGTLVAEKQKKL